MLCIFEMFSKKNLHRRKKDFFHVEWGVDEMVKNGRPLIDYMDITPSVLFFLSSQRYVDADDEKKKRAEKSLPRSALSTHRRFE